MAIDTKLKQNAKREEMKITARESMRGWCGKKENKGEEKIPDRAEKILANRHYIFRSVHHEKWIIWACQRSNN